jgi:hypothetical protein
MQAGAVLRKRRCYFQEPGIAEAELERDVRATMCRLLYGLSGDVPPADRWHPILPDPHSTMLDSVPDPTTLPRWLTEEELDPFVETLRYRPASCRKNAHLLPQAGLAR